MKWIKTGDDYLFYPNFEKNITIPNKKTFIISSKLIIYPHGGDKKNIWIFVMKTHMNILFMLIDVDFQFIN